MLIKLIGPISLPLTVIIGQRTVNCVRIFFTNFNTITDVLYSCDYVMCL